MSKLKVQDIYKAPNKKQQATISPRKQTEIEKYFRQLSNKSQSYQKMVKGAEQGENNIVKEIKRGKLEIKQKPNNLDMILIKGKIDEEELKVQELTKKKQLILEALEKLDMRIVRQTEKKIDNPQIFKYNPDNIFSKEEHEEIVQKMKKEQQELNRRAQERLKLLEMQRQREEQRLKKLQMQKMNSQRLIRRRQSQCKLQLRKQIRQLQQSQRIRSSKQLEEIRNKKFLHQKAQQQYEKTVIIPLLQQRKKKLKEIRDFNKAFDVRKLKEHEQRYLKERNKSMELLNSRAKASQEWVYKPPEKTQKLNKILQQELVNQKQQLEKSKKAIQQKLLRQENYVRLLKQKYTPKTDETLQKQIQSRIDSLYTRRREPSVDPTQVGNKYLQQVRQIVKSFSESSFKAASQYEEKVTPSMQSSRINYLRRNNTEDFYLRKRNENLSKIIQSKKEFAEKAREIEVHNKKIADQYKRKQQLLKVNGGTVQARNDAAELLLSGIKAKMGLIQLSN